MKRLSLKGLVGVLFLAQLVYATEKTEVVRADAKDRHGKIVYIEEDTMLTDGPSLKSVHSRYFLPDGKTLIAELTSDFSQSRYLPNTHFVDHRDDYEYTVTMSEDRKYVVIADRESAKEKWREEKVEVVDNLMTMQGSFVYVADHMDELKNQKDLHVHFLVPSRKTHYRLRIANDARASKDANRLQLKMEMESTFLSLFAPEFRVQVNGQTKQIEGFQGISNILTNERHLQRVVVDYHDQGAQ